MRNGRSRRQGERTPNRGWCSSLGTRTGRWGTRWCRRRDAAGPGEGYEACAELRGHSARWHRRGPSDESSTESVSPPMHKPRSRGRARPGPGQTYALHAKEGDSSPAQAGAFCRDRDPLLPRAHRDPPGTRLRTVGPSRPPASRMITGSSGWRMPTASTLTANLPSAPEAQGLGEEVAGSGRGASGDS